MKERMNDAELVKLCKKKDREALNELYVRYLPFINKKYFKFKKSFSTNLMEKEDFQNDCYFALLKAIDYVNFAKIPRPETWKFLGAFMYFIDGHIWETVRQYNRKDVQNIPLYITAEGGDEVVITDLIPDISSYNDGLESCYEKNVLETFYKSLDSFEMQVLKQRSQVREKGKPKQLSEIAKELGTNFNKIQETCKSLENKFKSALVY
jgi:hypothetical protein